NYILMSNWYGRNGWKWNWTTCGRLSNGLWNITRILRCGCSGHSSTSGMIVSKRHFNGLTNSCPGRRHGEFTTKRARALTLAGRANRTDASTASAFYQQSLEIARKSGAEREIADALLGLGNSASTLGNFQTTRALLTEALALYQKLGDQWRVAVT